MNILFFDTETSGMPLWNEPSEHEGQPHIVQIAAMLVDDATRSVLQSINLIVRPDGWDIPSEVAAIHGITTERAGCIGIPEHLAVSTFMAMHAVAGLRVAHNESFDARILRIALKRFCGDAESDAWKEAPSACTAKLATPLCALPPTQKMIDAKRRNHKTPTLNEAYKHFMGADIIGAHDAMADTKACMDVYFSIKDAGETA